jgi:hypothetical protein
MQLIHRGKRIHRCSLRTPFEAFEGFLTFGSPADLGLRGRKTVSPVGFASPMFPSGCLFQRGLGFPASSRAPFSRDPKFESFYKVLFTLR